MLLAQPVITQLNESDFALSGRVAITGTGLGSSGQVFIDGIQAWTTTWNSQRVVAYIPEQSSLGSITLYLVTGGQQSNSVTLNVHARQPEGRIKWRFECDGENLFWRPAEAPDGTIYIHSNDDYDGFTYALTPGGGLKWIRPVNWTPYCPVSAGPDNELYAGTINKLYRISPEGQIDWIFTAQNAQGIFASPKVGPTGLLHGGFEVAVEAFGIDPLTGELVWSNEEANISNWGTHPDGNEITFGWSDLGGPIDRFYIYWDSLYAFTFDGDHLFTTGTANNQPHTPAIGADGTMYAPGWLEYYMIAFSPDDGQILWQTDSDWNARISDMEIDFSDTLYFISDGLYMHAFDPHSQSTVWRTQSNTRLGRPTLSPDESTLITIGGGYQDVIGFVKAFSTFSGQELWNVDLQEEFNLGYRHVPEDRARISSDGTTAYVQTWRAQWPDHDGNPRSTLFAIAITDSTDVNADSLNVVRGFQVGGTLADVQQSDNSYLEFQPGITLNPDEPPVWLEFTGTSPTDGPASLSFKIESHADTVGIGKSIEFYNYLSGSYEMVHSAAETTADSVVAIQVDGDISRFVESGTGQLKVRLGWLTQGPVLLFPWTISLDQLNWTVNE